MLKDLLENKTTVEKAEIKSTEIVKIDLAGQYVDKSLAVEILKVEKIDGGIVVFATASSNGMPIGFGTDGTVEIERFRIFNPPILVDDPNGNIIKTFTDEISGEIVVRTLREDPAQALQESLAHTIKIVGKPGDKILKGSIGNTTDTFYPAATDTTYWDGVMRIINSDIDMTWASARGASGDNKNAVDEPNTFWQLGSSNNPVLPVDVMTRAAFNFNISAIGSDTVSSATFSLAGTAQTNTAITSTAPDLNVYALTPTSINNISNSDYQNVLAGAGTPYSTSISYASFSTVGYNDFAMNAAGIAAIQGQTTFSVGTMDERYDANNTTPTFATDTFHATQFTGNFADASGTSSDPKLVVVHTVASSTFIPKTIMF